MGKAGSDTTLAYAYILKTNGSAAGAKYVDAANADVTTSFAKGSGYQTTVYTAYKTTRHATESKHSTSATTKFDIYYAEIIPPVITLATDANNTPSNGTVTAKYANNGNNAVLNFHKLETSIHKTSGSAGSYDLGDQVGDSVSKNSANFSPGNTVAFASLKNGTQYIVKGKWYYSFGGIYTWASESTNTGSNNEVLGGIPYGKPLYVGNVSLADQKITVTVDPNGRELRESLFVGVPNQYMDANITVIQKAGNDAKYGSGNNASQVTVSSHTASGAKFGYDLAQGLVVVENSAGSAVKLHPTSV